MTMPFDAATRAVRAGLETDEVTGAVVPPIHLTSTFAFRGFGDKRKYDYSRSGNPTRDLLADALTELEGGVGASITGTGMSAIALVGHLLPVGSRIVAPHDCYGGSFRLFSAWNRRGELAVDFVDFGVTGAVEAALAQPTALLWIETPSNPLLRITDIAACAKLARQMGALTVVDNTFATPFLQQPLALGADIVLHSVTKYLGGHSDVVGGALVVNDLVLPQDRRFHPDANVQTLHEHLRYLQNAVGAVPGPMDCFLVLRGTKTLHLRMERHCANARKIADFLSSHPAVTKIFFPGLPSHPQHALAGKQMRGAGGMVSFEVRGGLDASRKVAERVRLFALAESLGGVESLLDHPAIMTHASIPVAERHAAGLADGLLRLSVGVEDAEDLVADLAQALEGI